MASSYSVDLRERVVAAFRSGLSRAEAAARFQVSESSVQRWARLERQSGGVAPKPMGGKRPLLLQAQWDWIVARIERQPDVALCEVLAELHQRGLKAGYHALWNLVRKARLSVKKNSARRRAGPPKVARRRAQWQARQGHIDRQKLVFVDG